MIISTNRAFDLKLVKTGCLVIVWICIGLCLEITGPTLIDLKERLKVNYESVATAVEGRSAGFFIGSAAGGLLVDKLGPYSDLILALSLDGMAALTASLPWMTSTELLFFISLCCGTCEGVINIAGQKLIINMWQGNSASPLHLLHGGFGIGSFIIPLIAKPFLAVKANDGTPDVNVTSTIMPATTVAYYLRESRIEFAYAISAVIVVVVSVVFYIYHCTDVRRNANNTEKKTVKEEKDDDKPKVLSFRKMFNPATCANGRLFYGLQIFILVSLFFFQAVGGERIAGKFIRSYAIEYFDFLEDDAIYLNTVFWILFTCGRIGAFVAAHWVPIRILIMIETGGCLVSGIALVFLGTKSPLALWIIMPVFAVFIAPLFPSGIGWANFHIDVTGIAITVFLLGGSVGGIAYMKVMGFLFDNYGPKMFLYALLVYGIAVFVISTIMNIIGAQHGSRFEAEKKKKEEIEISELTKPNDFIEKL